jgi:hypothetical protein
MFLATYPWSIFSSPTAGPRVSHLQDQLQAGLADRYILERELGRGGMATVHLAESLLATLIGLGCIVFNVCGVG